MTSAEAKALFAHVRSLSRENHRVAKVWLRPLDMDAFIEVVLMAPGRPMCLVRGDTDLPPSHAAIEWTDGRLDMACW